MLLFNRQLTWCIISHLYFNTSNVTIQPRGSREGKVGIRISIHLMLLFNASAQKASCPHRNFNTSNVTIQHKRHTERLGCAEISIHLMLLFNVQRRPLPRLLSAISIHLMLLFNGTTSMAFSRLFHFNTSNVTIQHYHIRCCIIII